MSEDAIALICLTLHRRSLRVFRLARVQRASEGVDQVSEDGSTLGS